MYQSFPVSRFSYLPADCACMCQPLFSYFTLCFIFMLWLPFLPLDTALFFPFFRLFCLIYVIDACLHCYSRCCAQGYVVLLLLLLLPFCFRLAIHCIGHVVLLLLLLSTFCSRAAILFRHSRPHKYLMS